MQVTRKNQTVGGPALALNVDDVGRPIRIRGKDGCRLLFRPQGGGPAGTYPRGVEGTPLPGGWSRGSTKKVVQKSKAFSNYFSAGPKQTGRYSPPGGGVTDLGWMNTLLARVSGLFVWESPPIIGVLSFIYVFFLMLTNICERWSFSRGPFLQAFSKLINTNLWFSSLCVR